MLLSVPLNSFCRQVLKYALLAVLGFIAQQTYGQERKSIDSLTPILSRSRGTEKAEILLALSNSFTSLSRDTTLMYAHNAKALAQQTGAVNLEGRAYLRLALAFLSYSFYDSTFYYSALAENVFQETHDTANLAFAYGYISSAFAGKGDRISSIRYIDSSLRLLSATKDTLRYVRLLRNKMFQLCESGRWQESSGIAAEITHLIVSYKMSNADVGKSYIGLGEYYIATHQFDSAIRCLNSALNNLTDIRFVSYIECCLGLAWSGKGDHAKGVQHALKGLHLAEENRLLKEMLDNMKTLYTVYSAKGDTRNALHYLESYHSLKDSISLLQQQAGLENVRKQLSLMKNVKQLELLKRNSELQQARLTRQKFVRNGFIIGFGVMLLFAGVFLSQRNKISKEKDRSERLLLNILPTEVAQELKANGRTEARQFSPVTVLFTDFVGFTTVSQSLTPKQLVDELHICFTAFDGIMAKYNVEKIKTVGDAYLAVCGLPQPDSDHAKNVVRAAIEIKDFVLARKKELGDNAFDVRIGAHSGTVVAGIVGVKKFAYDIWGDTVNTAARMEQTSDPGRVNISETTFELVKDEFDCSYRGEIEAKNKGMVKMYFVDGLKAASSELSSKSTLHEENSTLLSS